MLCGSRTCPPENSTQTDLQRLRWLRQLETQARLDLECLDLGSCTGILAQIKSSTMGRRSRSSRKARASRTAAHKSAARPSNKLEETSVTAVAAVLNNVSTAACLMSFVGPRAYLPVSLICKTMAATYSAKHSSTDKETAYIVASISTLRWFSEECFCFFGLDEDNEVEG